MGHDASFHDKKAPPPVVVHAGPVYASGALPADMVSVLEDYYCPDAEDSTFLILAIVEKEAPKARVNFPRLQKAVD